MKRNEINPILRNATTFDDFDLTKEKVVNIYAAQGITKLEKGVKLFDFFYEPLLNENGYNKLVQLFKGDQLLIDTYSSMNQLYWHYYSDCIKWYTQHIEGTLAFDFDSQIQRYKSLELDSYSCPIIKHIEPEHRKNIDFFGNLKSIMLYAEENNIVDVNFLLNGSSDFRVSASKPTHSILLYNSVYNIIYQKFEKFLLMESAQRIVQSRDKITMPAIAMLYFFIWEYEEISSFEITKTNALVIANKYGFNSATSGTQLYRDFEKYKIKDKRRSINESNGRQSSEHLKRYTTILPLLKGSHPNAYAEAKKEYDYLYNKIM